MRLGFAFALVFSAVLAGCQEDGVCPEGYVHDYDAGPGYCRADAFLEDIEDAGDVVVYGYAKTIEGGCGPGDTTCEERLFPGLTIEIYDLHALEELGGDRVCLTEFDTGESALDEIDVSPILEVEADDEARWFVALDPGAYCFSAIDPIDGTRRAEGYELGHQVRLPINWIFDHGGY